MKERTIKNLENHLSSHIESNSTRVNYALEHNLSKDYFSRTFSDFKKSFTKETYSKYDKIVELYQKSLHFKPVEVTTEANTIEEERNFTEEVRDTNGKISEYKYKIYIKNKPTLEGVISRKDMNEIYKLYSSYGAKLTQREISRMFSEWSLIDFRRILRAFNITKASSQFAPHMYEEYTIKELNEIALRQVESNFLKEFEYEKIRRNATLVKDQFNEIQKLKSDNSRIDTIVENFFNMKLEEPRHKIIPKQSSRTGMFHLSDLHVGAKVNPESLFPNEYNIDVLRNRLNNLALRIIAGNYDQVIINILGDVLDGMDGFTARRDHRIPQNMNNFEQVNNFLLVMDEFFVTLKSHYDPRNIFVYSVSHGNHDGVTAYAAVKTLLYKLEFAYNISCTLFDQFFGHYKVGDTNWIICHGKDAEFMKKGLPITLDDKTKIMIYNWLEEQGITGNNIYFIKGDLHSESVTSSYKINYRNVISLFGSSDYSMLNFDRTKFGVSYEIIMDESYVLRGSFTDL